MSMPDQEPPPPAAGARELERTSTSSIKSLSSSPDLPEAPLSSLFGRSFDLAAIESAAHLADNHIFITASGSRFRLQRLPPESAPGSRTSLDSVSSWGPTPRRPEPPAAPSPELAHLRPHPRPQQLPTPPQPLSPPPPPPSQHVADSAASAVSSAGSSPALSRSTSAASQSRAGRGWSWTPQRFDPDVDGAAQMMATLGAGPGGFGASALYGHSDGGVQAAETLTDAESADRLRHGRAAGPGAGYENPSRLSTSSDGAAQGYHHDYHSQHSTPATHHSEPYQQNQQPQTHGYPFPYQPDRSHHGPSASTSSAFTNPEPFSPPDYASAATAPSAPLSHHGFAFHGFVPYPYPGKPPDMAPRSQSLPSMMEESSPVVATPSTVSTPPNSSSHSTVVPVPVPITDRDRHGEVNGIDTLTPVLVRVHSPPSSIQLASDTSSSASASAVTRDNVLPGEDVLYDGFVKSAHTVAGPFEEGHLKVFRHNMTHDLRFHCKTGNNTDTHWMNGEKAQMVPIYAYDQRSNNIVFIRDNDGEKRHGSISTGAMQPPMLNGPGAIYQFPYLQDLFKFQGQLTGESVVLDISSVKWIRLGRAGGSSIAGGSGSKSSSSEMYSSVRLQIWHEPRSRKVMTSDQSSFVTAGTALSGPLRERTVPSTSRLMVFLGRSEQYITTFITDDVEMEPKGYMSVRVKPRKYSGLHSKKSKPGIRARLEPKSGVDPAGLDIHGRAYNPDVEQVFDEYKSFEIEFESSPSQVNFVQTWNEVLDERRKQRARIAKIQEEMRKETYSPHAALAIKM